VTLTTEYKISFLGKNGTSIITKSYRVHHTTKQTNKNNNFKQHRNKFFCPGEWASFTVPH
jgi:hypothetical protein